MLSNEQIKLIKNKIMELSSHITQREIVIFGVGKINEQLIFVLEECQIQVKYVIDNGINWIGKKFNKIEVTTAREFLRKKRNNIFIPMVSRYYSEMKQQLENAGYTEGEDFIQLIEMEQHNIWNIMNEKELEQKLGEVAAGYEQYKLLRKSYGDEYVIWLNPAVSIGDIFLMGMYIEQYCEKKPECAFAFCSSTQEKIARAYGIPNVILLGKQEMNNLLLYAQLMEFEKVNIKLLHTGVIHYKLWSRMLTRAGIPWVDHYRELFGLPGTALPKNHKRDVFHADEGRQQYNFIDKGQTVIIAPYTNTVASESILFWENLVQRLVQKGYRVYTNVAGDETPIKNTEALRIPIQDVQAVVEKAGYFIGMRSGICDILINADCTKIVLYSDQVFDYISVYEFYRLDQLNADGNIVEYIIDKDNYRHIIDIIVNQFQGINNDI